jgi:glucosamine-6-phosphate deaminase
MYKTGKKDSLRIKIFDTRKELGKIGAEDAATAIKKKLAEKESISIVFASAPSQMDVLNELVLDSTIDWSRVNAFHMDEYIGLPADAEQSFGHYIKVGFFDKVPLKNAFYIDGNAQDLEAECQRYEGLLNKFGVDIVFLGIGENGHLAFNDPHIADFNDQRLVKINPQLDNQCRQQQVTDGWFGEVDEIPQSAITLTMPALYNADIALTFVPGATKREIIKKCLTEEISTACPGSILRKHHNATLYLDRDSASLIDPSWIDLD